mgnify:CR=1 FL=1
MRKWASGGCRKADIMVDGDQRRHTVCLGSRINDPAPVSTSMDWMRKAIDAMIYLLYICIDARRKTDVR